MNKNFLIFGLLFLVLISGVSATLTDGLVSYWNFDDNGNDELGLNNLTITGATFTTGKVSKGIVFTNAGDKAQINSGFNWGGIYTTTTGMTMCGWYNSTDSTTTYQRIALFTKNTGAYYYGLQIRNELGGNFTGWFNANTGEDFVGTGITKGNTNFNFICLVYNSTGMHSYTNANFIQTDSTYASTQSFTPTQLNLGQNTIETSEQFKGMIDAFGFWNRTLSSTEITELYNEGAGLQYPFVTNFSITTNLADYNITMVSNETLNYDSDATTYTTGLEPTDARLWNITLVPDSILYNNLTFTNYNISLNGSLTTAFTLKNANISFTAKEIITNNNIYDFNISLGNGTTLTNSNSSHTIAYGTYNLTFIKSPYYNLTLTNQLINTDTTIDFDNVYNSILNITVQNIKTNTSFENFTGWVYLSNYTYNVTYSANGTTAYVPLIQDFNYTVYVFGNLTLASDTQSVYLENRSQLLNFELFTYNSINLNIRDENTKALIAQLVTVSTINNVTSFINTTSNGTLILDLLTPSEYELRFESANYTPRSIYLTVTEDSAQNITIYLTSNTSTELQVIQVLTTANEPLEGAVVWVQKEQLNSSTQWVTIAEAITNYVGKTATYIERSLTQYYRFAVIYNGVAVPIEPSGEIYTSKTIFIPGVTETIQLVVSIEETADETIDDINAIWTDFYYNNSNNTVVFEFLDGQNSIVGGKLVIRGKYVNSSLAYTTISSETLTGSSGTLSYTFPIQNNTIYEISAYIVYQNEDVLYYQDTKSYEVPELVEKNLGMLFAVAIVVVVALITAQFGTLASGIFTFGSVLILTYFGLINVPVSIVTTFLAIVVIFFLRPRQNGF